MLEFCFYVSDLDWNNWSLIRKVIGVLLAVGVWGVMAFYMSSSNRLKFPIPDALYLVPFLSALLITRLPTFGLGNLDVDESMYIAGANKLWLDGRFWISHDGSTSGPGVIYPLMLLRLFVDKLDYGLVRFYNLFVNFIPAILLLYWALKRSFGAAAAQVALLPVVLLAALFSNKGMLAYNGEQVCLLHFAASLFLLLEARARQFPAGRLFGLGLVLGLAPFTKLQMVPLAGWLGLWTLAVVLGSATADRWKKSAWLLGGALLPTILVVLYLWQNNYLQPFWLLYLESNLQYASNPTNMQQAGRLEQLVAWAHWVITFRETFGFLLLLAGEGLLLGWLWFRGQLKQTSSALVVLALGSVAFSFLSVFIAKNYFPHYLWLVLLPPALLTAILFRSTAESGQLRYWAMGYVTVCLAVMMRYHLGISDFGRDQVFFASRDRQLSPLAQYLQPRVKPGERLGTWGFVSDEFVTLDVVSANLQVHTQMIIQREGNVRQYLIKRYLDDMERYRPRYLVDDVLPQNGRGFLKDPDREGLFTVPPIAAYVRKHYRLDGSVEGRRIYRRIDEAVAQGRKSAQ